MSIVTAYTELLPGQAPPFHSESRWEEGEYRDKSSAGLEVVNWSGEYPADAVVYLVWEPRVYAVWEEEDNDEDGQDPDGSYPVERDEAVPAEPDERLGEGGSGDGDVPPAEPF